MINKGNSTDEKEIPINTWSFFISSMPAFASSIGQPYSRNDWSLFSDSPMSSRSGVGQVAAMEHSYHSEELQSCQSRKVDRDSLGIVDKSSYRESLFSYNEVRWLYFYTDNTFIKQNRIKLVVRFLEQQPRSKPSHSLKRYLPYLTQ